MNTLSNMKEVLKEKNQVNNKSNSSSTKESKQQPVKKKEKNVFHFMESTFKSKSPLSLLYKSIKDNRRIKVWTRSHSYVRSICTGYLIAYDQYWNLAMIDVDEVYRVPIKSNQSTMLVNSNASNEEQSSVDDLIKDKEIEKTKEKRKEIEKDFNQAVNTYKVGKFNLFERHCNQLIIRGDNVVTISLAD